MLVRPREKDGSGLEVLLMRRSAESAFAPRAYVFPGGVLDSHDVAAGVGERAYGLSQERVARDFRSTAHVDLPVAVEGRLGEKNIHGKINGGGNLLTVHTGDGSIEIEKL